MGCYLLSGERRDVRTAYQQRRGNRAGVAEIACRR